MAVCGLCVNVWCGVVILRQKTNEEALRLPSSTTITHNCEKDILHCGDKSFRSKKRCVCVCKCRVGFMFYSTHGTCVEWEGMNTPGT